MEAVSAAPSCAGYVVTVRVNGGGFKGKGKMNFVLEGEKIAKLDIR